MPRKLAQDLMIPIDSYPHVQYWITLKDAIREFESHQIEVAGKYSLPRVLLVFDDEDNLVGMVRRRDILRGLEPNFLRTMSIPHRKQLFDMEVDPNLVDLSTGTIRNAMQSQANQPVSEVMQPIGSTVDYDDHMAKIIYKMVSRDYALLPVIKDGSVIGVVRSVDVFHEIAKLILQASVEPPTEE